MTASRTPCPPGNGICVNSIINDLDYVEFSKNRTIAVEENKKKYIVNNINGECVAKVRIDGGIIPSSSESKADFMIIRCEHSIVYIIELKGSDVKKACEQILSTVSKLSELLRGATLHARIVCSRVPAPALRSSQYARLDRCCKSNKGRLIIKVNKFEETFDAVTN